MCNLQKYIFFFFFFTVYCYCSITLFLLIVTAPGLNRDQPCRHFYSEHIPLARKYFKYASSKNFTLSLLGHKIYYFTTLDIMLTCHTVR